MMHSMLSTNYAGAPNFPHSSLSTEAFFDELSKHLAANSRRYPRTSNGPLLGNTTRVNKASSGNSSPRSSQSQNRRRTMITEDGQGDLYHHQRNDMAYVPTPACEYAAAFPSERGRIMSRPMSWHPSPQHPVLQQARYITDQPRCPVYEETGPYSTFYQQFPTTPAFYSGYTSPASAVSPTTAPHIGAENQHYFSPATCTSTLWQASAVHPPEAQYHCTPTAYSQGSYQTGSSVTSGMAGWRSSIASQGSGSIAPPTPEGFEPSFQPRIKLDSEELTSEHSPDCEQPGDSEVLYGIGLYDAPDKPRPMPMHQHQSTLRLLMGDEKDPIPTGKGLKLEDSWEPPASDGETDGEEGTE